jgi:GNAT superfamily N-acetyltransferase
LNAAAALSPVETLEATMLAAWPALETVIDGAWVSRFARGHTKRANSLTILDAEDGGEVERRLDAVAAEYRRRGLPPTHRLTPLTPSLVRSALEARRTAPFEQSIALGSLLPSGLPIDSSVRVLRPTDALWIDAQARFHDFSAATVATMAEMLALIAVPAGALLLVDETGAAAAAALMLVTGGLAMLVKVVVAPQARGKGLGRRVVTSALGWAAAQGADEVFLHALADNAPAIALYRSLGLVERYKYSHMVFG